MVSRVWDGTQGGGRGPILSGPSQIRAVIIHEYKGSSLVPTSTTWSHDCPRQSMTRQNHGLIVMGIVLEMCPDLIFLRLYMIVVGCY